MVHNLAARLAALLLGCLVGNGLQAAQELTLIAVPDFAAEGVPARYARVLADALQVGLEKSGRIATRSAADMKHILSQIQEAQELGIPCEKDDNCAQSLGRRLKVNFVANSSVTRVGAIFIVKVRLIRIRGDFDIPTMHKYVAKESEIVNATRKIGGQIVMTFFPIEGEIVALAGDAVIVNVGSSNSLKRGDRFLVVRYTEIKDKKRRVQFREQHKVGAIRLHTVNPNRSKAEIDKGSGFKEGDTVVLDQEEYLKRLREEQEKEAAQYEEALAQLREQEEERRKAARRGGLSFDSWYLGLQFWGGGGAALGKNDRTYGKYTDAGDYDKTTAWALHAEISASNALDTPIHFGLNLGYTVAVYKSLANRREKGEVFPKNSVLAGSGNLAAPFAMLTFGANVLSRGGDVLQPFIGVGFLQGDAAALQATADYYNGAKQEWEQTSNNEKVSAPLFSVGIKALQRTGSSYFVPGLQLLLLPERGAGSGMTVVALFGVGWSF